MFGSRVRGKGDEFMVWIYTDYITRGWAGLGQPTVATGVNVAQAHEIAMSNGSFTYDGKTTTQASASFQGTNEVFLFCCNTNGSPDSQRAKALRVAFFEIDGKHLIPHLTADGQCGMLDLVTYTFHPNANTTGQFTIAVTDKA